MRIVTPDIPQVLRELRHVKQNDPRLSRRCFTGCGLHLNTWEDDTGSLWRFRLSYSGEGTGRWALLWDKESGFEHFAVDDGETSGAFHKASPQLIHSPENDFRPLASALSRALGNPPKLMTAAAAVLDVLRESASAAAPNRAAG